MWAIRRASNPLRTRPFGLRSLSASGHESEVNIGSFGETSSSLCYQKVLPDGYTSLKRSFDLNTVSFGNRYLSSQAGAESGREDDEVEEAFSEFETKGTGSAIEESSMEDEAVSEPGVFDDDDIGESSKNDLEISDADIDSSGEKPLRKAEPALFNAIISSPGQSVSRTLHMWFEEGKDLDREDISFTVYKLRCRRMFAHALQIFEWLKNNKKLEFADKDYVALIDLIAKVRGVQNAERFISRIPESYKTEVVYRTLLANFSAVSNVKKAEETFNKMKDLGSPISTFACNQMLLLYKRLDKKKIADVLYLMEKQSIKPCQLTYRILIDCKGQSRNFEGVDQIVQTMEAEGIKPETRTLELLAKHYASAGLKEKAKAIMEEMEGGNDPRVCRMLLPLYARTGEADEVRRLWKTCELNPSFEDFAAAIEAWGILNEMEEAEAVFNRMLRTGKKPLTRHYLQLLKVYGSKKMLSKGKDLVKQMGDSGCRIDQWVWDALVKLYADAGELERADLILQKASLQNKEKMNPLFTTYMFLMEQYAKRGDTYNAEKIFYRMREHGYVARMRMFQSLTQAYVNARSPAFGMRERIKADNIVPNKPLEGQLVLVDPFRKTKISDLLD